MPACHKMLSSGTSIKSYNCMHLLQRAQLGDCVLHRRDAAAAAAVAIAVCRAAFCQAVETLLRGDSYARQTGATDVNQHASKRGESCCATCVADEATGIQHDDGKSCCTG